MNRLNFFCCVLLSLLFVFASTHVTRAAEGLSFSLTPTIFDMAAQPGQAWSSSLKVVNNNPYELTVYATPVNFLPSGEQGHGTFIPIVGGEVGAGSTLAEWMDVSREAIVIPQESSAVVPINIRVPNDATPGGHYAAIMVGTRSSEKDGVLEIKTSQIITSLFFLRIAGDVIERGEVRTFRSASALAGSPDMGFEVRFENKGNVHLQPQGEIVITNMWGKERGIIPINHETNFGNVLPLSTRQFDFTWKGEASLLDIGRYRADLTLGYGQTERKFTTRSTAFWVVPVKPVLIFLVSVIVSVWFVTRSVRSYVRYMLRMSGIDPLAASTRGVARSRHVLLEGDVRIERPVSLKAPVAAGVRDLKNRLRGVHEFVAVLSVLGGFVRSYRIFFLSALGFILLFFGLWWYLSSVTIDQRDYEVTIENQSNPVTLSSETIMHDRVEELPPQPVASSTEQAFTLAIINASKTPGVGGILSDELVKDGYRIDELTADLDAEKKVSVIVFDPRVKNEAIALSEKLDNMLISAFAGDEASQPVITIFIGNDYEGG